MPSTVERKCKACKAPFTARVADVNRGWGLYCSKSCKAKKQEVRTGQYKKFIHKKRYKQALRVIREHWDGTQEFYANFSNEEGTDI